ncbi:hypothetical protein ElyMa_006476000 [Elysia marginata]|uniref:Uncharacterized protein n=1 Tax=Elysia marginata TaxID=1093978 RepID=A0AAV4I052_9GAST|nr:hypothetical protein ElyMa_006476000 [Elysia marginata]
MITIKPASISFHLNLKEETRKINIRLKDKIFPNDTNPKYLGMTLDRQFTKRKHLEGCTNKLPKKLHLKNTYKHNTKSFPYCLENIYRGTLFQLCSCILYFSVETTNEITDGIQLNRI